MKKIIEFVFDEGNQRFILFVILTITIVFLVRQCNTARELTEDLKIEQQNVLALQDSTRIYKNIAGEEGYRRRVLQIDKERLEKVNKELHAELEKERGEVEYLNSFIVEISQKDTIEADRVELTNQTDLFDGSRRFTIAWEYKKGGDGWDRHIAGQTMFNMDERFVPFNMKVRLTADALRLRLVTGLIRGDDIAEIFIRSTYPGLQISEIEGAIIRPPRFKPQSNSRFSIIASVGYGHTVGSKVRFAPYIGIGVGYRLWDF